MSEDVIVTSTAGRRWRGVTQRTEGLLTKHGSGEFVAVGQERTILALP